MIFNSLLKCFNYFVIASNSGSSGSRGGRPVTSWRDSGGDGVGAQVEFPSSVTPVARDTLLSVHVDSVSGT